MSVKAITPDYHGDFKDTVDKFHGKQLVNIYWEKHLLFAWPMCLPLPADMPFGGLIQAVLPSVFGAHPDFPQIDWAKVEWQRTEGDGNVAFIPDPAKSLADNGIGHKTTIRFRTPGLNGVNGTAN